MLEWTIYKQSSENLISTFSDLKSMNDDAQIWIMTTRLVVEDSPSYRPGCVTNGRVRQLREVTVIKVTVIKLTGDASRSQSSSSLPGPPIRNWGLLCITLWWEQCARRFGHLDSDSWRELGISSPKLKKKKPLEKKKLLSMNYSLCQVSFWAKNSMYIE